MNLTFLESIKLGGNVHIQYIFSSVCDFEMYLSADDSNFLGCHETRTLAEIPLCIDGYNRS